MVLGTYNSRLFPKLRSQYMEELITLKNRTIFFFFCLATAVYGI